MYVSRTFLQGEGLGWNEVAWRLASVDSQSEFGTAGRSGGSGDATDGAANNRDSVRYFDDIDGMSVGSKGRKERGSYGPCKELERAR